MQRKVAKTATPPSINVKTLNRAALTQLLDDPTCREAIARLACSGPGLATLREAQAVPEHAAGAIVYAFRQPGGATIRAVGLDALDGGGRQPGKRWRRTFGQKKGAVGGDPLVIVEGEADALASVWLHPGAEVWAAGGGGAPALAPAILENRRRVVIEADPDGPGRDAALKLDAALGGRAEISWNQGGDPADVWTETLGERAAILARLAMVDHTDRRAGRLFTPAAHAVNRGGEGLKLPGFGLERTRITPALPLALYDLGGGSSMERGHGAPLALRLWVESILAVGLTDRANPWPTVLEIPLRDLLRKLYPSKRRPRPNEYWPRLMQAVEILDSTRIPWEDPKTGKGGLQRIVNVSSIPRGPGALDDAVRIIVDLPPGSGSGPVVSPNLARYGVQSAPLYRGLLNLAYHMVRSRTDLVSSPGRETLAASSEDPERYPTITNDLLIELFYPTSS